jgi:hypothetical protein
MVHSLPRSDAQKARYAAAYRPRSLLCSQQASRDSSMRCLQLGRNRSAVKAFVTNHAARQGSSQSQPCMSCRHPFHAVERVEWACSRVSVAWTARARWTSCQWQQFLPIPDLLTKANVSDEVERDPSCIENQDRLFVGFRALARPWLWTGTQKQERRLLHDRFRAEGGNIMAGTSWREHHGGNVFSHVQ